ncbi:MAG: SDR family oxidoreductase [Neisseriaceae bacterium]
MESINESKTKDFLENDPNASYYIGQIPADRSGNVEDLAGPLLLLASNASSYMYGTILNVDGGFAIDVFIRDRKVK